MMISLKLRVALRPGQCGDWSRHALAPPSPAPPLLWSWRRAWSPWPQHL